MIAGERAGHSGERAGHSDDRAAELADPDCLAADEAGALLTGHPWRRLVVLGDSVAHGPFFPVPGFTPLRWSDRVAAELRASAPDLDYRNLGVDGLLTREVRAGQLEPALAFRPDLALVVCGGNDAFRPNFAEQAEAVAAELTAMLAELRAAGAQPVIIGIFDVSHSPFLPDRYRLSLRRRLGLLAEQLRTVAGRSGCVHVDLSRHPRSADPELYAPDGKHGNARSDAIAAAEVVRALGAWRKTADSRSAPL
ncbi:SGNH/GDSL hydrolase family protein [Jatrophihabitans sp.]|uniref:SGNH/GDSL hydrolase family protein n=1 Tax=Jatrophihabitans sp. TaxID=1932789 RepID=UPI002C1A8ACF|nr:SGNH/GDSL hydrolase family protein [Jatrophihabitans sp.]